MTERVYLLTRGRHDFGGSTCALIDARVWEIDAVAIVRHDERAHRLERVGGLDPAEVAGVDDDRHLEMLLTRRSR